MKWLRFVLLSVVAVAIGCSSAPSGSTEEPAPATDEVDEAQEAEALEQAEG